LIDICATPDYRPELKHSALAYSFFLSYIAARSEKAGSPSESVMRLRKILESDLAQPVELDKLAAEFKCRPETLIRKFSASFGVTPVKFRTKVRLRYACRLLGMRIRFTGIFCPAVPQIHQNRTRCLPCQPRPFTHHRSPALNSCNK
jgi:AraC-like DNA-binding protein